MQTQTPSRPVTGACPHCGRVAEDEQMFLMRLRRQLLSTVGEMEARAQVSARTSDLRREIRK